MPIIYSISKPTYMILTSDNPSANTIDGQISSSLSIPAYSYDVQIIAPYTGSSFFTIKIGFFPPATYFPVGGLFRQIFYTLYA